MNNLTAIEPQELYREPALMVESLAVARHMAETAAMMRRWPEMEAAIDILIERQQVIVHWWDDHVRSQGEARKKMQDSHFLSVGDAERETRLRQPQVSRFRTALTDAVAYRSRLIARVHRTVDPPDPSARRATPDRDGPDFWPTPVTLVDACVRHVLPLLPHNMPIWEPAAGDGRLARAIEATGLRVYATDLYPQDGEPPVDFLDCIPPAELTCVVTNPPYNASDDFIDRCMALFDRRAIAGFALLLRHDHLQAGSRVAAFNSATAEVHCNWRPIWIDGTEGQPRWSFHWLIWTDGARRAPFYLAAAA